MREIDFKIELKLVVESFEEREALWEVYENAYKTINRECPCKQSYSKIDFRNVMEDSEIQKFVLYVRGKIAGLGIMTNKLDKVPWISEFYFEKHFSKFYRKQKIYYIKCLAIDPIFQNKIFGLKLLKEMINSIPKDSIGAFDCSEKASANMALFAQRAENVKPVGNGPVDRQIYWVFEWRC